MTLSLDFDNYQSIDMGHLSLLAFLSHLAEICRKVHPGTPPCIKDSDFEVTLEKEAQTYFRSNCPAYTHYKQIFGEKRSAPFVRRIAGREPWQMGSVPEVSLPVDLSRLYIENAADQLADYLTNEFESPFQASESKNSREVELEQVVSGYIKLTENLCFNTPKLLLDIKDSRNGIEQQKTALFDGDTDGNFLREFVKNELDTLRRCLGQVSKSILIVRAGDNLLHSISTWVVMDPRLGNVQKTVQERRDKLSHIQCFQDLPRLESLCFSLKETCKELIRMTEIVSFQDSSSEGTCTADVYDTDDPPALEAFSSSESETALDSSSRISK